MLSGVKRKRPESDVEPCRVDLYEQKIRAQDRLTELAESQGKFICAKCYRLFDSQANLYRHYRAKKHMPDFQIPLGTSPIKRRQKWTFAKKSKILMAVTNWIPLCNGDIYRAKQQVASRYGIHINQISTWLRDKERIMLKARTRGLRNTVYEKPRNGKWYDAELRLYFKFIYRRRYQALRVTRKWLMRQFKKCRAELDDNVEGWKASGGWCSNFCRRWSITSQCRTNKKKLSIEERLPKIRAYHRYWIYGVQCSGEARDAVYGRYPPSHIYSMDQVPMPFSSPAKRSLNEKGAPQGCRFVAGSEDDKRFCTLNVTMCADAGNQDVRIEIIFRSDSGGACMPKAELEMYRRKYPDVKIRWQRKAWADEPLCMDYLIDFREATLHKGDVAMIMDGHASQCTPRCKELMDTFKIKYVLTPAGCTDCVAPVDRNCGVWIKNRVYELQEDEMDQSGNRNWAQASKEGGLSTSEKRMHVVRWVSQAWKEFKRDHQSTILAAFVDTGALQAKDGSEMSFVRLTPKAQFGSYSF